jgi:hypothetical protein
VLIRWSAAVLVRAHRCVPIGDAPYGLHRDETGRMAVRLYLVNRAIIVKEL